MKVLAAGLDYTTVAFLNKNGIVVERQEIESVDDLDGWFVDKLFDAGIIDLEASGLGVYAARGLREKKIHTPIIGVSTGPEDRTWSDYRAQFLENGGDDLLRAPVNPRELIASLRAATRRFKGALIDITVLEVGAVTLRINHTTLSVQVNGMSAELTGKETLLLLILASAPGRTFSKEGLLAQMYAGGVEDEPELKIIDVFVCKVRKKLAEIHPDAEGLIETVWGRGYRLTDGKEEVVAA